MKVTSIKQGKDYITIIGLDGNQRVFSVKIGALTENQQKAFDEINIQVKNLINHENPFEARHSLFQLSSVKYNEKAKKYILGGTMAQHRFADYQPYSWSVPDVEMAKMKYVEDEDNHYVSIELDTARLIEAFLNSFEVDIMIQANTVTTKPLDVYQVGKLFAEVEKNEADFVRLLNETEVDA